MNPTAPMHASREARTEGREAESGKKKKKNGGEGSDSDEIESTDGDCADREEGRGEGVRGCFGRCWDRVRDCVEGSVFWLAHQMAEAGVENLCVLAPSFYYLCGGAWAGGALVLGSCWLEDRNVDQATGDPVFDKSPDGLSVFLAVLSMISVLVLAWRAGTTAEAARNVAFSAGMFDSRMERVRDLLILLACVSIYLFQCANSIFGDSECAGEELVFALTCMGVSCLLKFVPSVLPVVRSDTLEETQPTGCSLITARLEQRTGPTPMALISLGLVVGAMLLMRVGHNLAKEGEEEAQAEEEAGRWAECASSGDTHAYEANTDIIAPLVTIGGLSVLFAVLRMYSAVLADEGRLSRPGCASSQLQAWSTLIRGFAHVFFLAWPWILRRNCVLPTTASAWATFGCFLCVVFAGCCFGQICSAMQRPGRLSGGGGGGSSGGLYSGVSSGAQTAIFEL